MKKNWKKLIGATLACSILAATVGNSNIIHAVETTYTGESIAGVKPVAILKMWAEPDVGEGHYYASLSYQKGGSTRKLEGKYFYETESNKYYSEGSSVSGGLTEHMTIQKLVPSATNVGAKSYNTVKYNDTTWKKTLRVGNPPTTLKGWTKK